MFDWPQIKAMVTDAATELVADESIFELRRELTACAQLILGLR